MTENGETKEEEKKENEKENEKVKEKKKGSQKHRFRCGGLRSRDWEVPSGLPGLLLRIRVH